MVKKMNLKVTRRQSRSSCELVSFLSLSLCLSLSVSSSLSLYSSLPLFSLLCFLLITPRFFFLDSHFFPPLLS